MTGDQTLITVEEFSFNLSHSGGLSSANRWCNLLPLHLKVRTLTKQHQNLPFVPFEPFRGGLVLVLQIIVLPQNSAAIEFLIMNW